MTSAPVNPGDVLAGKYRVERVLGAGAMGVVLLATHMQLDERVALKFLLPEALANSQSVGRFVREARLAVKLKSEHVAKVLDVGTLENGSPYIVMEYLEGENLNQILKRGGPMPVAAVAEYVIQACDAIAEAHALGIVHRDLKPANLFLTQRPDGGPLVKVLDFGISKTTALNDGSLGLTKTESILGSPYYMSPEQMKSAKDVDVRSDVWSVGVIVYQLLTTRLPFEADTFGELMGKVLQEEPLALAAHRPDVPPQVANIVARCLQRERGQRAASVAEIVLALAPYAPPRAHPIAERIALLLSAGGAGPGHLPDQRGSMPSFPMLATSQALGASQGGPKKGLAVAAVALIAVAGLAVIAGVGFGVRQVLRSEGRATTEAEVAPSSTSSATPAPAVDPGSTAEPANSVSPPVETAQPASSASVGATPSAVVQQGGKPRVTSTAGSQKPAASASRVVPRIGRD